MSKYEEYVSKFHEDYEEPTVDGYIVGNSGLTPKPKVKPEKINHDDLGGLKGGDFDGYYHLTGEELEQFSGYQKRIDTLEDNTEASVNRLTNDISSARQEASTAISNLRTETNQGIATAKQEASSAVSTLRNETAQGIATVRQEASSAVTTLRNETTQGISSARQEASTAVSNLRTQTTQEIDTARQEAASSVTALRNETSRDISDIRTQTNTAITGIRSETTQKIGQMSSELDTAKTELSGRISTVEGSQAEIEAEQEQISARIDEIVGGATEDTEILDARVDADGDTHANLGANIRSIHERVKTSESAARGREQVIYEHVREQDDNLAKAILTEALDRREEEGTLKGIIANWQKRSQEISDRLLEGLNDLSEGEIRTALNLSEESTKRKHAEKVSLREIERVQEGVNENAYSLMKLAFQMTEKSSGGTVYRNPLDWSKAESIAIPEPRCAVVNISGINSMPESRTVELSAVMEFWDMAGNYFRKNILCAAQGKSSMSFVKKNMKFDLLNDDGSEFEMKIGDWVSQDGFHLKAYYTDYFRGVAVASYKFWDEIMRFNGMENDRPWKKALHVADGVTSVRGTLRGTELQLDGGALCHPDGFPCLVYLNGEFYGIFSWQIKKQRKNYHMDKSTVEHIHLDGTIGKHNDFVNHFWNGRIDWTQFEVRNPNKLYTMDGKKYDGDAPKELIDATSAYYDPDNKDHVRTAKVKGYIQGFVQKFSEINSLYAAYKGNPTAGNLAAVKAKYEEIFDVANQRDYLIFSDVILNHDGLGRNWQWTTYDGVKWWVNAYDLDCAFGSIHNGLGVYAPRTSHIENGSPNPTWYTELLYTAELDSRYAELREAGIIDGGHITSLLDDWVSRIGTANFELEYEKWPDSPCMATRIDSIYRVKKWIDTQISNMDNVYHYVPGSSITAELEQRLSSMEMQIEALRNEIDPDGIATDTDIDEALVGVWNTDVTVETEPEFDEMLNDIWNVNP